MEWKSYGEGASVLVDGKGEAVARFETARWDANVERELEVVSGKEEGVVLEALVSLFFY